MNKQAIKKHDVIVVASGNKGKVREFARYFGKIGLEVRSLHDFEGMPEVIEDGDSFYANALKKAKTAAQVLHIPVLADDSGLEVDRLNGEPGIYSARYAGEPANDERNNRKLIQALKKITVTELGASGEHPVLLSPARYVCELVLYDPSDKRIVHARGEWEGHIIEHPRGENGFGYDPHFYIPSLAKTAAELEPEEKNNISHRGRALVQLVQQLEKSYF